MSRSIEIPYGCYWSTPFARWQGSFAGLHALEFAAHVARNELARRDIAPTVFDYAVLGMSVPQKHSFSGTRSIDQDLVKIFRKILGQLARLFAEHQHISDSE